MCVSFFNEPDSFSEVNCLYTEDIIKSISLNPRIGDYYNNSSFGYGGYRLPKDIMQLQSGYRNTPNSTISAIVEFNNRRKKFIADRISEIFPNGNAVISVFKLNMKTNSDNDRESSIIRIIDLLQEK